VNCGDGDSAFVHVLYISAGASQRCGQVGNGKSGGEKEKKEKTGGQKDESAAVMLTELASIKLHSKGSLYFQRQLVLNQAGECSRGNQKPSSCFAMLTSSLSAGHCPSVEPVSRDDLRQSSHDIPQRVREPVPE
jgi:hypothetical protein